MSYSNNEVITDPKMINLNNIQLKEFGQTPEQLFIKPHPRKFSNKIIDISVTLKNLDEEEEIKKEKNKEITSNSSNEVNTDDNKINDRSISSKDSINQKINDNVNIIEDAKEKNSNIIS